MVLFFCIFFPISFLHSWILSLMLKCCHETLSLPCLTCAGEPWKIFWRSRGSRRVTDIYTNSGDSVIHEQSREITIRNFFCKQPTCLSVWLFVLGSWICAMQSKGTVLNNQDGIFLHKNHYCLRYSSSKMLGAKIVSWPYWKGLMFVSHVGINLRGEPTDATVQKYNLGGEKQTKKFV